MSLHQIDIVTDAADPPVAVTAFLREADARINRFYEERWQNPIIGFVPSDFLAVWRVLEAIRRQKLAPGTSLCEWGAGFGVVAGLAALAGYHACGIEIEQDLVAAARQLAADFALKVEFACGNFIPYGGQELARTDNAFSWLEYGGPDGYELLGLEIDDFDLVFAYPWPGEEEVIERLFHRFAIDEALLITFRGQEGVKVQRKLTGSRGPRS